MDMPKKDFEGVLIHTQMPDPEDETEDGLTSFGLASKLMESFEPAFVLIGAPFMIITESGYTFPSDIGIVLNDKLGVSKSAMAIILREIADQLDGEINAVMDFIQEATKPKDE